MKLSEKLWCDLKTDIEKHNWLLLGRGYETGVVAHVIQTDLANTYNKIINLTQERDTYRDLCEELLKELKTLKRSAEKLEAPHENQSAMFFYYLSGLRESVALSNSAITKSESILGETNGR